MSYKWKPSKKAKREFAKKMDEVSAFCSENGISASASNDSFYFKLNNQEYRVSNHSIEASNRHAYRDGIKIRVKYHPDKRESNVIYIHAGKTRIINIYNDLKDGYSLDGRGNRVYNA